MSQGTTTVTNPISLRQVGWWLGGVLLAVAGVAALYSFDPNTTDSPFAVCIFQTLTGFWCAGCGITRALHALVHGDIAGAFAMNPLGMLLLPLMPLMVAWGQGWHPRLLQPVMAVAMQPKLWLWVLPGYWVARNLPWVPFCLLAPG